MKRATILSILLICSLFCISQPAKTLRLLKAGEFQKAIDLTKEKENKYKNPIKYHLFLARGYAQIGNDIEAENEYQKALALVQKKTRKLQLMDFDVVDELSLLRVRTGNWEGARSLIDWSIATRTLGWNKKNPANFRPYLPLGILHFSKTQIDSARFYLKTYTKNLRNSNYTGHLDIDKYADAYQTMAQIALEDGDLQVARKYANKCSRLQRHEWTRKEIGKNYPDRVVALNTLTTINLRDGKYKRAKSTDRRATYLLNKHLQEQSLLRAGVYLNKAHLSYQTGELDSAESHLRKVMDLRVQYVKTSYAYLSEYEKENSYSAFERGNTDVIALAFLLMKESERTVHDSLVTDLYNYVINTKAVILSESNKLISSAMQSSTLAEQLGVWKDLKKQWYYLNTVSKRRSKERAREIQLQIVALEKSLARGLGVESAKDWKSIASNLKQNEVAIEFTKVYEGDSSATFLAFKITNQSISPEVVKLVLPTSEERFISYYSNSIKFDQVDTLTYSRLWEPLKIGSKIKKVYLSPSGILHKVNFNTLRDSDRGFIADLYSLVNVSNTGNLTAARNATSKFTTATLIGLSDFSDRNKKSKNLELSNLPGVISEVNQIDSILNSGNVETLTFLDEKAQENTLNQTSSKSILHLATHGMINSEATNPMLGSGLIFSAMNDSEDGILTAYEASLLDLEKTELVVLSACGSGLGSILDGEGVYGLQRAFEVAGVQNIVMSMWNIDDEFTQYFMNVFYSSLLETQNVPLAFQSTLKSAKRVNPNPRYWGAFKLVQFF